MDADTFIGSDNRVWSDRNICNGREFILDLKLGQLPLPQTEIDDVLARIRFTRQPKTIWCARIPEQYKSVFAVFGTGDWVFCRNLLKFVVTNDVTQAELTLPDGWAETCDLFETLNGLGIIAMIRNGVIQQPYEKIIYDRNRK
jgi:hypothetical protein